MTMTNTLTAEQKKQLAKILKDFGLLPLRGEVCISVSPEGAIGNIKVVRNL